MVGRGELRSIFLFDKECICQKVKIAQTVEQYMKLIKINVRIVEQATTICQP